MKLLLIFLLVAAPSRGIDETFFAEGGTLDNEGAPASAVSAPITSASDDLAAAAGKLIGAVLFVSLLIVGLYKLGRKARLPFFGAEGIVRKIAMEPIGPNQYINVVEIGGKVLVLGMSEKGMTMLTELDGDQIDRVRLEHSERSSRKNESFTNVFKNFAAPLAASREENLLGKERSRLKNLSL